MIFLPLLVFAHSGSISFENPGIRLEQFLKEISKQTGQQFRCPTFLNNEVLAASFKDQSIDVVKSQLARVIHGTWEQKPDGWWLTQTFDQKKEELTWHREIRRSLIQTMIDAGKAHLPKKEWTINDAEKHQRLLDDMRKPQGEHKYTAAERRAINAQSADSRFAATFLSQLKPEMFPLDSLTDNFQLYTINGDGLGQNLPLNLTESLAMMDREVRLSSLIHNQPAPDSASRRILFTVPHEFPIYPSVVVYDGYWRFNAMPDTFSLSPLVRFKGETFPLSPSLKQYFEAIKLGAPVDNEEEGQAKAKAKYKPLWNQIRKTFLDAANHDPLGIEQGRCWIDFASSVTKPLLVSLGEDQTEEPKYHVPTVEQNQANYGMMRVDEGGWVLGRPANPLWNRTNRVSRDLIVQVAKLTQIPAEDRTIEDDAILADMRKYADQCCLGIPNDRFLPTFDGEGRLIIQIFGACLRAGIRPNDRTGIINFASIPEWGQKYIWQEYVDGSLGGLIPESKKEICPQVTLAGKIRQITVKVAYSTVPMFEFKDSDGEIYSSSVEGFARIVKDLLDKKAPIDLMPFKIGLCRHVDLTLGLESMSMESELYDPMKGEMKSIIWANLDPAIKRQVLEKIKEINDEIPPAR